MARWSKVKVSEALRSRGRLREMGGHGGGGGRGGGGRIGGATGSGAVGGYVVPLFVDPLVAVIPGDGEPDELPVMGTDVLVPVRRKKKK